MKWKDACKLTTTKITTFIGMTLLSQIYTIQQITHPICTGPCGEKTFVWQFQVWGKYTLFFFGVSIVIIGVVSVLYELIKRK